jgi:hypothetical protein
MTDRPLPDRWSARDFPVLVAIARRLDAGKHIVDADDDDLLAELEPLDRDTIANALIALANAEYIDCGINVMLSGHKHVAAHTPALESIPMPHTWQWQRPTPP